MNESDYIDEKSVKRYTFSSLRLCKLEAEIVLCDSALGEFFRKCTYGHIFKTYVLVLACNLNHKWFKFILLNEKCALKIYRA